MNSIFVLLCYYEFVFKNVFFTIIRCSNPWRTCFSWFQLTCSHFLKRKTILIMIDFSFFSWECVSQSFISILTSQMVKLEMLIILRCPDGNLWIINWLIMTHGKLLRLNFANILCINWLISWKFLCFSILFQQFLTFLWKPFYSTPVMRFSFWYIIGKLTSSWVLNLNCTSWYIEAKILFFLLITT